MGSPVATLRFGAAFRIAYGLLAIFAPNLVFKAFGPDVRYFNALFGGRDIVVGGWIWKAIDDGELDTALAVHMGCEATDTAALVQEIRQRGGLDQMTTAGLVFNLVGWATWIRIALARR